MMNDLKGEYPNTISGPTYTPTYTPTSNTGYTPTYTPITTNGYTPINTPTITPTNSGTPTPYPPLMTELQTIMEKHPSDVYPDSNTLSDLSKTMEAHPDLELEYLGKGKWGFSNPHAENTGASGGFSGTSQGDWYDTIQDETGGALPLLDPID